MNHREPVDFEEVTTQMCLSESRSAFGGLSVVGAGVARRAGALEPLEGGRSVLAQSRHSDCMQCAVQRLRHGAAMALG